MIESNKPKWYALQVEPGREKLAAEELRSDKDIPWRNRPKLDQYLADPDCDICLPLTVDRKMVRGEVIETERALIKGYLFIRTIMGSYRAVDIKQARGVLNILPSAIRPAPVSDEAIKAMRKECAKLIRTTGEAMDLDWMLGEVFNITSGPYAGRQGPVIGFGDKDAPVLMLEMFGQLCPVPIPLTQLDLQPTKIDPPQDVVDASESLRYRYKQSIRRKSRGTAQGKTRAVR